MTRAADRMKKANGGYDSGGGVEIWISLFDGPTIGTCGGDGFGTDGRAVISAARVRDPEESWTTIGMLVHPWNDVWVRMELGSYPDEEVVHLDARTHGSAVVKAMPIAIGYAIRLFAEQEKEKKRQRGKDLVDGTS